MYRTIKLAVSALAFAASLGVTGLAAQEQTPEQPQTRGPGMMQDGGTMSGDGMMPMMGMMRQMSEMMETCNEMMQARAGEHAPDEAPSQP